VKGEEKNKQTAWQVFKGKDEGEEDGESLIPLPSPITHDLRSTLTLNNCHAGYYWTVRFIWIKWIDVHVEYLQKGKTYCAILWTYLLLFIAVVLQGQNQRKL